MKLFKIKEHATITKHKSVSKINDMYLKILFSNYIANKNVNFISRHGIFFVLFSREGISVVELKCGIHDE